MGRIKRIIGGVHEHTGIGKTTSIIRPSLAATRDAIALRSRYAARRGTHYAHARKVAAGAHMCGCTSTTVLACVPRRALVGAGR